MSQPAEILSQPVVGFQAAAVHSIALRPATVPHRLSLPGPGPVIRAALRASWPPPARPAPGRPWALAAEPPSASTAGVMHAPASSHPGRPRNLRPPARRVGGRRLAARAPARRVTVEVQHPRGLVAFAAPRRPPRSGRWQQLGRGEPGRQHRGRVADPSSVRPVTSSSHVPVLDV